LQELAEALKTGGQEISSRMGHNGRPS
jgi:hypothetical protein